ncbi:MULTISPECIES: methyltransferase [unclassified Streptomyces]|uniref:methyltransferase n=1 Tax=unclassified Streptomyces TaxID=2593676 RepID=UPI002DD988A5|nr:methyltransferase [Streptomyces sp. NBC_01237]WRZ77991.1 acetylserotonin O-methyltransferase [Streptomyces sp. NBC_01237]
MTEPTAADRGAIMSAVFGYMTAQTLAAAVRLKIADHLGETGRPAADVASELGTDPGATRRLLRALAASGLATEPRPGVFALTPRGTLLRTDRPDSVAEFVGMFLDPTMVSAWGHLDDSVRTGRVAFDDLFGSDFFGFLAKHPELSRAFNASMRQGTRETAAVLPRMLGLDGATSITDVGGGDGTLLAAILTAHPHLRGVLFDSPQGSAESGPVLDAAGVTGRCEVTTGDFFAAVPAGSDVYLLKSIVHDWDDERVVTILGHIRAVIPPEGRLLIVEPVLPETVDGSLRPTMYLSDLNMLVNVGGRERTEAEFRSLCERAGFSLAGVTRLPAPAAISVIEAVPA